MITVKFNGTTLNGPFVVGNIKRPLPEFRPVTTQVDGADGNVFESQTVGTRSVAFDVIATAKTARELQDQARTLLGILLVREPVALTFSDEKDKEKTQLVRYAVPTGAFDAEEFKRMGKWHCELLQPSPFLYGKRRSIVIAAGKTVAVDAGGNAPSFPTATATVGSGDYYQIRIPSGPGVRYAASFNGQKITVSMSAQTVRTAPSIAGADGLQMGSRFFVLQGVTKLNATHETTVTWRERWL